MSSSRHIRHALAVCVVALLPAYAAAQDLASFEKSVTEFTLDNGLHFIILERHDAPVVSFHTFANVGSVDDPKGETGLAHMFEHMAFKGTPIIGSNDWAREKVALDAVDEAYEVYLQERQKGIHADEARVAELGKAFQESIAKAAEFAAGEEFTRLIEESGGSGLNASTSSDETQYYYSLPSNRVELWFYL
jgi:predicted Zn-dependent peptidase